jgi:hypothetical protein
MVFNLASIIFIFKFLHIRKIFKLPCDVEVVASRAAVVDADGAGLLDGFQI